MVSCVLFLAEASSVFFFFVFRVFLCSATHLSLMLHFYLTFRDSPFFFSFCPSLSMAAVLCVEFSSGAFFFPNVLEVGFCLFLSVCLGKCFFSLARLIVFRFRSVFFFCLGLAGLVVFRLFFPLFFLGHFSHLLLVLSFFFK